MGGQVDVSALCCRRPTILATSFWRAARHRPAGPRGYEATRRTLWPGERASGEFIGRISWLARRPIWPADGLGFARSAALTKVVHFRTPTLVGPSARPAGRSRSCSPPLTFAGKSLQLFDSPTRRRWSGGGGGGRNLSSKGSRGGCGANGAHPTRGRSCCTTS